MSLYNKDWSIPPVNITMTEFMQNFRLVQSISFNPTRLLELPGDKKEAGPFLTGRNITLGLFALRVFKSQGILKITDEMIQAVHMNDLRTLGLLFCSTSYRSREDYYRRCASVCRCFHTFFGATIDVRE